MTEQEVAKLREEAIKDMLGVWHYGNRISLNEPMFATMLDLVSVRAYFSTLNQKAIEDAKKEGYEQATKRAIEMAVFNIPYDSQGIRGRLVGIVIPQEELD